MNKNTVFSGSAERLLRIISDWGPVTTIVINKGHVFEFKGPFPKGELAHGYYNLTSENPGNSAGFEGHLKIDHITSIKFQEKTHRGKASYAFIFEDANEDCVFKIFLGRDKSGEIIDSQLNAYRNLQQRHQQ